MNLLEECAFHLEWLGFGKAATAENDGNIHWARMPDDPDDCICLYSTDSGVGGPDDTARIQVMVRSKSARHAYETAYSIAQEFDKFNGFLCGDGRQVTTTVINAASGLGADSKKREVYVSNIAVRYCN